MQTIAVFIGATFVMYVGRGIFLPLLVAVFFWYLLNAIAAYYRKALPLYVRDGKKPKPGAVAFDILSKVMSLLTFGGLAYAFTTQIKPAFAGLMTRLPEIQHQLLNFKHYLYDKTGIALDEKMLPDTGAVLTSIGGGVAQISAAVGLVLIYILFMYIEQSTFKQKLAALVPQKKQLTKVRYIIKSIDGNMKKYMFVKTLSSAIMAIISYMLMSYMGLEFAGVWAFIIFVMNYIPTFGTIVSVTLPVLYSLIIGSEAEFIILLASGLVALQILIGNVFEPRLTGKTLNLSTLAILINLVFWGVLWGPVGMFFSVPILVAAFIATAQFDHTRWIAVLLSANGEIPAKEGD